MRSFFALGSVCIALLSMACGEDPPQTQLARSVELPAQAFALDGLPLDPLAPDERADLLIFLRTDCPISGRYAPEIARIAQRLEGTAIELWLVYVDPDEDAELIRRHLADYGLPGTPLRDPDQVLAARTGVRVTPEVALFDAAGSRLYRGRIDNWYADYGKPRARATTHELDEAIQALLRAEKPAQSEVEAVGCPLPPLPGAGS